MKSLIILVALLAPATVRGNVFSLASLGLASGGGGLSGGNFQMTTTLAPSASGGGAMSGGNYSLNASIGLGSMVVQTPAAPFLSLAKTSGGLVFSWAVQPVNFHLESTASLGANANWTAVALPAVTNNGIVTVTFSAAPARAFYRLHYP